MRDGVEHSAWRATIAGLGRQSDGFFHVNCGTRSARAEYATSESRRLRRVSSFLALTTHQLTAFR